MESRSLRVSAVQMVSENGDRRANLARAGHLVQEAADAGAKLVALPELFSGGYWLNEQAWDTAEPEDGPTEVWLRETAHRHGIYLGGSYLQARDEDFVNVFSLATPTGQIAGRVSKQKAASVESYLFRGVESSHIIDTGLGRVGVGICYDNLFRYVPEALIAGNADIVVMSFSAPTPQQTWYYRRKQVEAFRDLIRHRARNYARMLGIPAIQVNKSGAWKSPLPAFFPPQDSRFEGRSEIADSDGEVIAELTDQEAVIVGDVTLDPARKVRALGKEYGQYSPWIAPVSLEFRLYRFIEAMGARSYRSSPQRRARARAISDAANGRQG